MKVKEEVELINKHTKKKKHARNVNNLHDRKTPGIRRRRGGSARIQPSAGCPTSHVLDGGC